MKHKTAHTENIASLKRIEGQVRGIQKMLEEQRYCVDIIFQIYAVVKSLYRVAEKILAKHIEQCVADAFKSRSEKSKREKIEEIIKIVKVK